MIMRVFKSFAFLCALFPITAYAGPCEKAFSDPESFNEAMTKQLFLSEGQQTLLELYFKSKTPYPEYATAHLEYVFDLLKQYPELSKLPVREQILEFALPHKEPPQSLKNFISSFRNESSRLRNSLFQVEENLGFWAKMLNFSKIEDSSLSQKEKSALRKKRSQDLIAFLNSTALNKELRDFIKDSSKPYRERTIALYKALQQIKQSLDHSATANFSSAPYQKAVQNISQAMAKLIYTAGFGNKTYMELLKSKDPQESLKAVKSILNEGDILAFELGFEGHFAELKASLNAKIPDKTQDLSHITKEVQNQPYKEAGTQVLRLRPLSIQESPFRSCFGGDCATQSYFETALDPNFLYFTLTNSRYESSGHITLVLGKAKTPNGLKVKTAFVDKIQNIEPQKLKAVLQGIYLSLKEQGYVLALPKNVGNEDGLSNEALVNHYVEAEILPHFGKSLNDFTPYKHRYKNLTITDDWNKIYSKAYHRPALFEVEHAPLQNVNIKAGEIFTHKTAPLALSPRNLYDPLLLLEKSTKTEEQIRFLTHLLTMRNIKELNISDEYVNNHLNFIIQNKDFSFQVRKKAFYTLIEFLLIKEPSKKWRISFLEEKFLFFSEKEKQTLIGEISNWQNTVDYRKEFIEKLTENEIRFAKGLFHLKQIFNSPWSRILDKSNMLSILMLFSKESKKDTNSLLTFLLGSGADVNRKNNSGGTALMIAAERGHIETVKLLINNKADINLTNNWGNTALMIAAERGHIETVKLLLDRGADINSRNNAGKTALMTATLSGFTEMVKLLLDRGADINSRNNVGETALMMAAKNGHLETIKLLLDKGADINSRNNVVGETALMMAAKNGHLETVKLLLDRGADVNSRNNVVGETALMMAAKNGHLETVKLLLDRGADVNIQNTHGRTALDIATQRRYKEIIKLFSRP